MPQRTRSLPTEFDADLALQLKRHRDTASAKAARKGCFIALPILILFLLLDLIAGQTGLTISDCIGLIGCLAVRAMNPPSSPKRFNGWPLYVALWLSSSLVVGTTGGIDSPFCCPHLILIVIVAYAVQNSFRARYIIAFAVANLAFWTYLRTQGSLMHGTLPLWLQLREMVFYVLAAVLVPVVWSQSEAELARDALLQRRELLETQSNLERAARMAEVGELVASAAHEISQPVQSISFGSAILERLMRTGGSSPERIQSVLTQITDATRNVQQLLLHLKNFSRSDGFNPEELDLRDCVRSIARLLRSNLEIQGIHFEIRIPPAAIQTRADPLRVQQILLNLLNNARDACFGQPDAQVRLSLEEQPGFARIRIENTGSGISPEIQARLFHSCLTTKARGKGTGLGLRITEQLVKLHRGRILFCSDADNTCFVVDFPQDPFSSGGAIQLPVVARTNEHPAIHQIQGHIQELTDHPQAIRIIASAQ